MSTIKVNTIQNTSGVEVYTAKAWVNFNGTGTVAIRASGNVSSITDNGTGDYTVNFTTAMPDTNYSNVFSGTWDSSLPNATNLIGTFVNATRTTSALQLQSVNPGNNARFDSPNIFVAIFR
jgi:uncharacterized protein (AIM24 family)